jgi:hypothetical protein
VRQQALATDVRTSEELAVAVANGIHPARIVEAQRHELLSGANLFDALETAGRLLGRWDVACPTTQRTDIGGWQVISR